MTDTPTREQSGLELVFQLIEAAHAVQVRREYNHETDTPAYENAPSDDTAPMAA